MTSAAILAHPDFSLPFEIHADAGGYGLGALLLQRFGGNEGQLASRLMTPSELNYSTTEQECLALVWALKKFRYLIWSCPIRVVTDHYALCW